jgi:hypothetical protein
VILLEGIAFVIIAALCSIVTIYAAITIGNMSSKHKLLAGVGAYLGFGIIEQIVMSIIITSFGGAVQHYFESLNRATMSAQVGAVQLVMLGMILYSLVFGVVYYILTNWMLQRKLNLE